MGKIIEQQYQQ